MSYYDALQAAGATVHAFEQFGSYQGHWIAKVTWKGETGWIYDCYGSCSGCDAYEAEIGYPNDGCDEHEYNHEAQQSCSLCANQKKANAQKLADFGKRYLDDMLLTQEQIEEKCKLDDSYHDDEDRRMLQWVKDNRL
jgi:hypothetical protein